MALRDRYQLPGMKILQFAFHGDPNEPFLPHNYVRNCVVYTGTHDNDTTCGWWATASEAERKQVREVLGTGSGSETIAWDLIEAAMASVAQTAIVPVQDVLSLGSEARFNTLTATLDQLKTQQASTAADGVRMRREIRAALILLVFLLLLLVLLFTVLLLLVL